MLIKKDKKSLFSISLSSFFFNKKFFSTILKFLGILQIILVVLFLYFAVTLDKDQIKELLFSTAQKTYWLGRTLTYLPIKWSNKISSQQPTLSLEIAPKNYQLLMTLKNDAIKIGQRLTKHNKKIPAVINYKNDKFDVRIRLKGDDVTQHLDLTKWSMRIEVNNNRFMDMKAFNLQHPLKRSYMASFVLHKFLEKENLTTKRFNLIPVAINGKYIGIYNFEEIPDHNMNESLTGINNIVVYVDDDPVTNEMQYGSATQKGFQHNLIDNFFYNSIIRAHSLNEVLRDNILKKDFERASKLLNDFRSGNLAASEVFDIDKLAIWLAMTDLFGANHQGGFNLKYIYDRDLDRLYPTVWDAISNNSFSSVGFHKYNLFKYQSGNRFMMEYVLSDQNVAEKYLTILNEITTSAYIDNVMEIIKPEIDDYMAILHLDYPQFKIEDELKRLKENAEYLRKVYLYPDVAFNAYMSGENEQDNLILVNRKPVPIKIIALIDTTTDQQFKVKVLDSDFILKNNIPGEAATPTKVFFECPMNDCFTKREIKKMRIIAKVVGTSKKISVKINNWVAYE